MSAGVEQLLFGHQRLGPFDDITHAVDEALLLRWQDELIVHLEGKTSMTEEVVRYFTPANVAIPQCENTLLQHYQHSVLKKHSL